MKKNKRGMSFMAAYLIIGLVPMIISVIVVGTYSSTRLKNEVNEGLYQELRVSAKQVKEYFEYDIINNGKVDYDEYSDHKYIESLQDDEIELTLFYGDTRLLTSIKNPDGSYNEGTKANEQIYQIVSKGEEYKAENVDINGEKYMVYYIPVYGADGNFWGMAFAGEKQDNAEGPIYKTINGIVVVVLIMIVLFTAIIVILARMLAKTLSETKKGIEKMAEGYMDADFSDSIILDFSEINVANNILQKSVGEAVSKTKKVSDELKESSERVSKLADNSQQGVSQIASAMDDLAQGSVSMAESVQDISEQIGEIGAAVGDIYVSATSLVDISGLMENANKDASDYINRVSDSSEKSVAAVNDITKQIDETNKAVEHIKNAVEMISSIASQTNLLALNASIEAARAGEAGKGFAVVADEIKSLSEQTNESTAEINKIVDEIVGKSARSVALSSEVAKIIEQEQEYIEETKDKFEVLNQEINKSVNEIDGISEKVKVLNTSKEVISEAVEGLGAISEENAASNQQVSASVEGILDAISGIADDSKLTNQQVDDLLDAISYFK